MSRFSCSVRSGADLMSIGGGATFFSSATRARVAFSRSSNPASGCFDWNTLPLGVLGHEMSIVM